MSAANHYDVLRVSTTAPVAVIRAAHRALMREHHPDAGGATDAMAKSLNEALRVLADERLRAAYDAALAGDADAERTRRTAEDQAKANTDARAKSQRDRERERVRAEAGARAEAAARTREKWLEYRDPASPAGFNVFERNRINLSAMDWYTRDYPPLGIRDGSAKRAGPLRFLAWFLLELNIILAGLFVAGIVAGSASPAWWRIALLVLLVPVAALAGGWARARARGRGLVRYLLFLGFAGGILVPALVDGRAGMLAAIGWLGLYLLTVEILRASATRLRRPDAKELLGLEEITGYNHWDLGASDTGDAAGNGGIHPGKIAELLTGQLLESLHVVPGARTLAGLSVPGNPQLHIGHAVLCGDRLALVDSRCCPGGQYYWWENQLVCKLPGDAPVFLSHPFPGAVQEYRARFPELKVRGWSVFHPMDGAAVLVNNRATGANPRLATAEAFLEEAGEWLGDGPAHIVDRVALTRLVNGFGAR
ncbi:hypothetical protein GCM10009715_18560 [Paeniglutamicibacter psychrophenolicus]|uniref:Curved DNA-binding protein CbpA n=1 Tax=Paeniglutamicibacter psychrophenolicus TaxID=257454 RepID=A0ABS4WD16_9MICC|nr:J domain-containing protein [Paeniglutamicibacter psychrophenolicus]MBP2374101.1 curved DNA-binding protein CbpA [Paeniglutamicibacter psychrophenolicus]